jgi:hypothetical protein
MRKTYLFLALLISGCANMDKDDCQTADWRIIGFEDGSYGRNEASISQHRKECSEHGVTPNLDQYRAGHLEGSKRFCTNKNGFSHGNDGKRYKGNCPVIFEDKFLAGFTKGQKLNSLRKSLNMSKKELEHADAQIHNLTITIEEKNELMIADGLNREQRKTIRDEIEVHKQEQIEILELLPLLSKEYDVATAKYQSALRRYKEYL